MRRDGKIRIAALIFAHDESLVIGETAACVRKALGSGDDLFVIADNCTDDTAQIANDAGANVYTRTGKTSSSKAMALTWFLDRHQEVLQPFDFLLVLDADSKINSDFLEIIKANIPDRGGAFQCFISPLYEKQSPVGVLAALSYFLDQGVSDRIRTSLRWPVRLRGTGMLIAPEIFIEIGGRIETMVEDIALSLLLTARGVHIGRIDEAIVYDPLPDTTTGASHQRARWFRGQWNAIWQYRREIISIGLKGPRGWSLLSSLFFKPRWLILTGSLILALVLSRWWWLSLIFWGQVLFGLLYLTIGLFILPDRKIFILALLHLPAYVFMWVRSIILSLRSAPWLKARKEP
jgi:cellulose synthase/poly-beta-1,6-N-acetylglucosamine synthase-like glycosyltransferase